MGLLSTSLLIFALLPRAFSVTTTVTLYEVLVPPKDNIFHPDITVKYSATVAPVGVGSDGMTTYSEKVVISEAIVVEPTITTTLTDSRVQTTTMREFAVDASGYADSDTITNLFDQNNTVTLSYSCQFEGTTAGVCVDQYAEQINGEPIEIKTTTYSGRLSAFYTVTETAGIPGQTQSSQGVGSQIWKSVDLIKSVICLVALRSMIGFLVV